MSELLKKHGFSDSNRLDHGELSITELLHAYADWVNDNQDGLGCKSPSLMLMRSAPKLCAKDVKSSRKSTARLFISDDDALAVDKAMKSLRTYSLLLYRIIVWRYIRGNSERAITKYLIEKEGVKISRIKAQNLISEAHGYIGRCLVVD